MALVFDLLHLACFQGSSMLQHASVLHAILLVSNIPLYGYNILWMYHILCLAMHQSMDIWVVDIVWLLCIEASMNTHIQVCVDMFLISTSGIAGSYGNYV